MIRNNKLTRTAIGAIFLTFTLIAAHLDALAGSGFNVYHVSKVSIRAVAADAVHAKRRAFALAEAKGLKQLLARITLSTDADRLPALSDEQLGRIVRRVIVEGETSSFIDYSASFSFDFDPVAVRALLTAQEIPFTDRVAPVLLVIPVYHDGSLYHVWQHNPVEEAWRGLNLEQGLVPMRLPRAQTAALTPDIRGLLTGEEDELDAIRIINDVDELVIALCMREYHGSFLCSLSGHMAGQEVRSEARYAGGSDPLAVAQNSAQRFRTYLQDRWKRSQLATAGD